MPILIRAIRLQRRLKSNLTKKTKQKKTHNGCPLKNENYQQPDPTAGSQNESWLKTRTLPTTEFESADRQNDSCLLKKHHQRQSSNPAASHIQSYTTGLAWALMITRGI